MVVSINTSKLATDYTINQRIFVEQENLEVNYFSIENIKMMMFMWQVNKFNEGKPMQARFNFPELCNNLDIEFNRLMKCLNQYN